MNDIPHPPSGFRIVDEPRRVDPLEVLKAEGFTFTNGYRTKGDTAAIRAQGYTPAENSFHTRGDGVDLDHPALSRRQQRKRLKELFGDWPGAEIIDEGHHRHLALPGWGAAPGTPGTANFGLPPLPEGYSLTQRGSLTGGNWQADASAPEPVVNDISPNEAEPTPTPSPAAAPKIDAIEFERRAASMASDRRLSAEERFEGLSALRAEAGFDVSDADLMRVAQNGLATLNFAPSENGRPAALWTQAVQAPAKPTQAQAAALPKDAQDPRLRGLNREVRRLINAGAKPEAVFGLLESKGIPTNQLRARNGAGALALNEIYQWRRENNGAPYTGYIDLEDLVSGTAPQGPALDTPEEANRAYLQNVQSNPQLTQGGLLGIYNRGGEPTANETLAEVARQAGYSPARADLIVTEVNYTPILGAPFQLSEAGRQFDRGEYGSSAVTAVLAGLDLFPGGRGGKTAINAATLRLMAKESGEAIDLAKATRYVTETANQALSVPGARVVIHTPEGSRRIVGSGLTDETGQSWAGADFLDEASGFRLEVDTSKARRVPRARDTSVDIAPPRTRQAGVSEGGSSPAIQESQAAPVLSVTEVDQAPQPRVVDRIDINDIPPPPAGFTLVDEPTFGTARRVDRQATADELAAAARRINPEDVTPIPANRVESLDEFREIPTSRPLLEAPNEATELQRLQIGRMTRRGPMDLSQRLRRLGGLQDQSGELSIMGVSNQPRRLDFGNDRGLGKLVNNSDGLTLDEATLRLWEEGWFPDYAERPSPDVLLDALREEHVTGGRVFHPDDLDEVERFRGAQGERFRIESAADGGSPLVEDIGQPVGLDDLRTLDSDIPATAYEDLPTLGGKVANINIGKLETRGDIRRALRATEDRFGGFDAARRGRINQAETSALADELHMSVEDLLKRRKGQALNAEQALAARRILAQSADELTRLATKVRGGSDAEIVTFQQALLRHAAIQEQVTGATAEAGRALSQFKMTARAKDARVRVLQGIVEGSGGRGRVEDVADAILDLQRDPAKLNAFALAASKPKLRDKLVELYVNSLLSGPQTHAVNFVSNLLTQFGQVPEHLVAAGIGAARRGASSTLDGLLATGISTVWPSAARVGSSRAIDAVTFSEVGARAIGMVSGVQRGLRNGARAFLTEMPTDAMSKAEQLQFQAISGTKGKMIRLPTRALMGGDELFKGMARQSAMDGMAVRQAFKEGKRGAALRERAAELAVQPTPEMVEEAFDYARYVTFQRPTGPIGQAITRAKQSHPLLTLIVPFVRTPTNLLKFSVERSPFAPLLGEWRKEFLAGGAKRDLAISRAVVGSGIGAMIATWAAQGLITGGGPADPNAVRLMRADGWQPYSIKIGDRWVSYQRLDPYATVFGIASDLATKNDKMTAAQQEHAATVIVTSVLKQLESKTWISGLVDLVKAIEDPQRFGQNWIDRTAGSILVPTGLNQITKTLDPVQRDKADLPGVPSFLDSPASRVLSRIPGLSDNLPAKTDVFGKPVTAEGGAGPDILSPLWISTERNDPVARELLRLRVTMEPPAKRVRGVKLTDAEFRAYSQLSGRYTYEDTEAVINHPDWEELSEEDQKDWIEKVKRDAREAARDELQLGPKPPPGFSAGSATAAPSGPASLPPGYRMVP